MSAYEEYVTGAFVGALAVFLLVRAIDVVSGFLEVV